jgi:predicted methyltransferase
MSKFVKSSMAAMAVAALSLGACNYGSVTELPAPVVAAVKSIDPYLASPIRTDADKSRDQYRHPKETVAFFQIDPSGKIGEYAPGGGWWTTILAPWVNANGGQYYGIGFNPETAALGEKGMASAAAFATNFPVNMAPKTGLTTGIGALNTRDIDAHFGTFDFIMATRMMHNMLRWGVIDSEFTAMHALLKPGGLIGIEQHRAPANAAESYVDGNKGYLKESQVIAIMERNGFELVGKSEINANPLDPANHAEGVWTLPPAMRGAAEADKARLEAIGETDRMTMLFRKK